MKTSIIIIRILIAFMVMFLMLELSLELDVARRAYEYSNEDYLNGDYLKFFKTIEDVNENRINSYRYTYGVIKFLFIWNTSIVFLVLLLLFLEWKAKSISTRIKE